MLARIFPRGLRLQGERSLASAAFGLEAAAREPCRSKRTEKKKREREWERERER